GQDLVRQLLAHADVFVENSRPGTMDEFGLGHDTLRREAPRPPRLRGPGRRQPGPRPPRPGQHRGGGAGRGGAHRGAHRRAAPAVRSGITIADHTTATFAALGVVAALRQRDQTGVGQIVDVAMLDVLTALVFDEPVDHYAATGVPVRTGNADARGAPINAYQCADGWIAVTCTSDAHVVRLCELMEQAELVERFPDHRARSRGAQEVDAAIERWTSTRSAIDVEAAFEAIGFPAGRVRDPVDAANDEAVVARGLLEPLRHPDAPPG